MERTSPLIGRELSHFKITAKLGEGGMGEVYRAEDTRLEREVAIKVLPEAFVADPERLARFEREAKVLASLNHPNIAAIHGLEEADGVRALVMELVEGDELGQRIANGPPPLDEALTISRQIAEALEAAHESGIVHRDLKPANVMLMVDGQVKILDFGLAKAMGAAGTRASSALSQSPTITHQMTQAGALLGTAAYMAPEQARGQEADKRADIWAFGVVLLELLTGERTFAGETVTDTLAAVLTASPDFEKLPNRPIELRHLLERCLEKDPRQRLRDIGEARIVIERLQSGDRNELAVEARPAAERSGRPRTLWIAVLGLAILAAGVVGYLARPDEGTTLKPMQLAIQLATNQALSMRDNASIKFAPDGKSLVFPCLDDGVPMLCRRILDEPEVRPIAGTERARTPFFSLDGRWIGFVAGGRLKKVAVEGGRPFDLGESIAGAGGAAWLADGTLVLAPIYSDGLFRIAEEGGESVRLTTPDREAGELGHWWPNPLPGGEKVIFTAFRTPVDRSRIGVLDLVTGSIEWIVENAFHGQYAPSGHLLYAREHRLYALPFDHMTATAMGAATVILDNVLVSSTNGRAMVAVSMEGAMAYVSRDLGDPPRQLEWIDREGRRRPATSESRRFSSVSLSPDGTEAALTLDDASSDLWTFSFGRGTLSRLTTSELTEFSPVWSHDGRELFYVVDSPPYQLFRIAAGSPDDGRPIWDETPEFDTVNPWASSQGEWMAYSMTVPNTGEDIYVRRMDSDEPARVFRASRAEEVFPSFSPDGRWLAYQSDETGRPEIYVEPFPGPGERYQITADGGNEPIWAPTGELFLRHDYEVREVRTRTANGSLSFDAPETLFSARIDGVGGTAQGRPWDVSRDGQRVLVITIPEARVPRRIELLTDWTSRLEGSGSD